MKRKRRPEPRTLHAAKIKPGSRLDLAKLKSTDQRLIDYAWTGKEKTKPIEAYLDREGGWVVEVFDDVATCDGTPWEGTLRVGVIHRTGKTYEEFHERGRERPTTWDELQAIKEHFWPGRIAIEIYPPRDQLVNVADVRWLWVLPAGAALPFNLQSGTRILQG